MCQVRYELNLFTVGTPLTEIDEEIGGVSGMKCLSQDSARLKTLNIGATRLRSLRILLTGCAGLVLDEGLASQNNKFKFFYGERVPWCTDSL